MAHVFLGTVDRDQVFGLETISPDGGTPVQFADLANDDPHYLPDGRLTVWDVDKGGEA